MILTDLKFVTNLIIINSYATEINILLKRLILTQSQVNRPSVRDYTHKQN